MNLEDILNQLKSERSRLNQAISALEGLVSGPIRRRGRPPKSGLTNVPGKRTMSAAARRRIAAAMKSSVGGAKAWIETSCDTEACDEKGWQPSADEPSGAEEAVRLNEGSLGSA